MNTTRTGMVSESLLWDSRCFEVKVVPSPPLAPISQASKIYCWDPLQGCHLVVVGEDSLQVLHGHGCGACELLHGHAAALPRHWHAGRGRLDGGPPCHFGRCLGLGHDLCGVSLLDGAGRSDLVAARPHDAVGLCTHMFGCKLGGECGEVRRTLVETYVETLGKKGGGELNQRGGDASESASLNEHPRNYFEADTLMEGTNPATV